MDLKRLVTHFAYRIEPKPDGGFVAHASDPSVPPLEAPTREELQQKIQQNIFSALSAEFPGLKLPPAGSERQFAFHVERAPEGGFSIHSADPNAAVIHASTQEEFEGRFLEKLLGFAGKHLMPQLSQALAAQGGSGDIKVIVNRKTAVTVNAGSHKISPGFASNLPLAPSAQLKDAGTEAPKLEGAGFTNADLTRSAGTIDNSPITPEPSNIWNIFRFFLALLIVAAMIYFFLHYR